MMIQAQPYTLLISILPSTINGVAPTQAPATLLISILPSTINGVRDLECAVCCSPFQFYLVRLMAAFLVTWIVSEKFQFYLVRLMDDQLVDIAKELFNFNST